MCNQKYKTIIVRILEKKAKIIYFSNNTTGQMTVYWNAFRTNNFTINSDTATYTPVERAIRNDQLQKKCK